MEIYLYIYTFFTISCTYVMFNMYLITCMLKYPYIHNFRNINSNF